MLYVLKKIVFTIPNFWVQMVFQLLMNVFLSCCVFFYTYEVYVAQSTDWFCLVAAYVNILWYTLWHRLRRNELKIKSEKRKPGTHTGKYNSRSAAARRNTTANESRTTRTLLLGFVRFPLPCFHSNNERWSLFEKSNYNIVTVLFALHNHYNAPVSEWTYISTRI